MEDFGLYVVLTDPVVGYATCCEALVRAGVRMVQLRMKEARREEIVAVATELRAITAGTPTRFIVNDDPSIAAEVHADGVHVGQSDMPVAEVRRRYPELGIVGLSTHSLEQALAAKAAAPDYIGVGPVYPTPTKKIPDPVLGVDRAIEMIQAVPFPAVAIGGLNAETLPGLIRRGARNWAVVRAVCGAADPYAAVRALQALAGA
ncbi:MAG: thiamine phosphate synthase [Kiritimatiellae bacterium]|nr:thiamine phosphate synthase [Kiritimatiellia bacterium]